MAARFALRFSPAGGASGWQSTYVAAYGLRGTLLPLLRDKSGVEDLHGSRYVLCAEPNPGPDGNLVAHLSVGDDSRVDALMAGLDAICAEGTDIRAGGVTVRLAESELVDRVGPDELLAASPLRAIRAHFATITTFAAGDRRSRGVPDPALIIGSWASSWNGKEGHASPAAETGESCPTEVIAGLGRMLDPIAGTLTWSRARLSIPGLSADRIRAPRSLYGFSGSLQLRLHRSATADQSAWLGRLASLARFVGTGYHVQLGLGVTNVI